MHDILYRSNELWVSVISLWAQFIFRHCCLLRTGMIFIAIRKMESAVTQVEQVAPAIFSLPKPSYYLYIFPPKFYFSATFKLFCDLHVLSFKAELFEKERTNLLSWWVGGESGLRKERCFAFLPRAYLLKKKTHGADWTPAKTRHAPFLS